MKGNAEGCVRFLWADSSPDRHHDWLWSEQHYIKDSRLVLECFQSSKRICRWLQIAGVDPWEVPEHCRQDLKQLLDSIQHHVHTPAGLGSGKKMADLAQKSSAIAHSMSMENPDWSQLLKYLQSFVSVTTDMGTESGLTSFRVSLANLFPSWRSLHPIEVDGEDNDVAAPDVPNLEVPRFFLEQALPVMGMQRIVYNLLKEVHTALPFWREIWEELKNLEALLNWNFRHRRYIATCLKGTAFEGMSSHFEAFSQSLYEARWHEVANFIRKVEPLLPVLRSTWDSQRFQNADDNGAGDVRAPAGAAAFNPDRLSQSLWSPKFAARFGLLGKLETFPEQLAGWAEDCPCHGAACANMTQYKRCKLLKEHFSGVPVCPMAGKRAPELAVGCIAEVFDSLARQALTEVLLEVPLPLSAEVQAEVISDFQSPGSLESCPNDKIRPLAEASLGLMWARPFRRGYREKCGSGHQADVGGLS